MQKRMFGALGLLSMSLLVSKSVLAAGSTFGDDVRLLKQNTDVVVLSDATGRAQVAVVPKYQGRVMTSTANGAAGASYGWINRKLIVGTTRQPHFNAFGGEDRFWLGPEGGQYGLFFPPGAPYDLAHWQTPTPVDWGGWKVASKSRRSVRFRKAMALTNQSGHHFNVLVDREVRLLSPRQVSADLGLKLSPQVRSVAYESVNRIRNAGQAAWTKRNGLLSIWILGQFNPSPAATIVIPFKKGPVSSLGRIVNDAYFGKVPADRLVVNPEQGVLFFKADGKHRSKIGIPPQRAKTLLGSYDAAGKVLTIVQFTGTGGARDYVNSMWEQQKQPFAGDTANSYNDGPQADGSQLGPFYELESSSHAAALRPGGSLSHTHRTIHLQGPEAQLNRISQRLLGVSLADITGAFK